MRVAGSTTIPDRVAERAATRYRVVGECYISTYSAGSHGYGQIGWQCGEFRTVTTTHRAAWVYHNGQQIPLRMTVDHNNASGCTSRQCVRREHLRLLTRGDNAARNRGQDWPLGQCKHGHLNKDHWVPESETNPKAHCRQCRKNRHAAENYRNRMIRLSDRSVELVSA